MAITYRNNGPWGAGKLSNLTADEVDENFWDHEERIVELETNPPEPIQISNITLVGTQLTIYLEDLSSYTFTVPQAPFAPTVVDILDVNTDAVYDLTLADANKYYRYLEAYSCTVMIPADDTLDFDIDSEITFRQAAAGQIFFDGPTDVVIHLVPGFLHATAQKGATITCKKVAANEWELTGWLAEDTTA